MRKIIIFFSLLAISGGAYADEVASSLIMNQNKAGSWAVTPTVTNGTLIQKIDAGSAPQGIGSQLSTSGWMESVKGEYGINDMISVGVTLGYEQLKASYKDTLTPIHNINEGGMLDPVLFEKTRMAMGPGTLKYGVELGLSLDKHKYDPSFNQNAASGGMWAAPWVGYEMEYGPGVTGARLTYNFMLTSEKWSNEAAPLIGQSAFNSTVTGGAGLKLDLFYEWALAETYKLGFDLNYAGYNATKQTPDGGTATSLDNGTAGIGAGLYGLWLASLDPRIAVVPVLQYGNYPTTVTPDVKTQSVTLFSVNVKYYF